MNQIRPGETIDKSTYNMKLDDDSNYHKIGQITSEIIDDKGEKKKMYWGYYSGIPRFNVYIFFGEFIFHIFHPFSALWGHLVNGQLYGNPRSHSMWPISTFNFFTHYLLNFIL